MIALSQASSISAHLYMLNVKNNKRCLNDLNTVAQDASRRFNKIECKNNAFQTALLGFHAYTGCDTIAVVDLSSLESFTCHL